MWPWTIFARLCAMGRSWARPAMLNTVWNDDGEGIFDENWFGVLFGAAAGWQPGEARKQAFTAIVMGRRFTATRRARSARRSGR